MIRVRASSLSEIMSDAKYIEPHMINRDVADVLKKKTKTAEDKALLQPLYDRSLSSGAKTFLEKMAKEYVYGFNQVISGKEMDKGTIVEDNSIALYNSVFFTSHAKNAERRNNDWLTGECDIFTGSKVIDIKSPWSLATFPATVAAATAASKERGYDWQGRAYMMLWDVDQFEVAFCMVSTPDELIRFEQEELHYVDHIPPHMRVTVAQYRRDKALEDKIKLKVEAANQYLDELVNQINAEHA